MISVTRIPEEVSYVATYIFRVQRGRQSIKLNLFISSIRWLQFTDNKQVASIVYLCKRLQPRDAERSRLRGWLEGRFWRGCGWDAVIRTPIRSSRGCSLTVRRRPNKTEILFYQNRHGESSALRIVDWKLKMNKWLRVSVLLGLFASAGLAVDWKALKPQGYVSDFANVIDPASKSQLEAYCAAVERSTGAQIALVTINTLEAEPIDDVANTIYRAC